MAAELNCRSGVGKNEETGERWKTDQGKRGVEETREESVTREECVEIKVFQVGI